MSGNWTGHDHAVDGPARAQRGDAPHGAAHARARAAVARRERIARRERRRAERVWRLTLADHLALWRARHRRRITPGWWPR
jgi:hypothetical protein